MHGPDRRPDGPLRLYCDGVFLGIGKVEQGRVKLAVHLYE
ncbi:MAG: tRNA pseudouridine(55) synthase TruB [Clostridia bacterium]|nr:tRNA pseudouridine(55) synthase TruB [Clostridia bacterium]